MNDGVEARTQIERMRALAENAPYEETRAALEECVRLLEQGGLSLSDSVACYEVGLALADRCQTLLREAELRISVLDGSGAESGA